MLKAGRQGSILIDLSLPVCRRKHLKDRVSYTNSHFPVASKEQNSQHILSL